jgi:glycogen operon protein
VTDDRFLLLFNAGDEAITFTLPDARLGTTWEIVIDTTSPAGESDTGPLPAKSEVELSGHAAMILRSEE